jgi:hypothetical protein
VVINIDILEVERMTVFELEQRYKEKIINRINDDVLVVDLFTDKRHSVVHYVKLIFAYNKLYVSGDYGSFIFGKTICNVFKFFKGDNVNLGYWQEKVEASPRPLRNEKVDCDGVCKDVIEWYEEYYDDYDDVENKNIEKIAKFFNDQFSKFNPMIPYAYDTLCDFMVDNFMEEGDNFDLIISIIDNNRPWDAQFEYIAYVVQWVVNNLDDWEFKK